MSTDNPFGEVVFSYSRAQAIADGVLVDLSTIDTIRQHWKVPFACTSAVWAAIEAGLMEPGRDVHGICHDISVAAKLALNSGKDTAILRFTVSIGSRPHLLKLHIGPGDTADPVLTLMLPTED